MHIFSYGISKSFFTYTGQSSKETLYHTPPGRTDPPTTPSHLLMQVLRLQRGIYQWVHLTRHHTPQKTPHTSREATRLARSHTSHEAPHNSWPRVHQNRICNDICTIASNLLPHTLCGKMAFSWVSRKPSEIDGEYWLLTYRPVTPIHLLGNMYFTIMCGVSALQITGLSQWLPLSGRSLVSFQPLLCLSSVCQSSEKQAQGLPPYCPHGDSSWCLHLTGQTLSLPF